MHTKLLSAPPRSIFWFGPRGTGKSTWTATALTAALLAGCVLTGAAAAGAASETDAYAGVFVGNGWTDSRIVDLDGFSNWGNPGWTTDYDEDGFIGGALIGKGFALGGMPLRVELSGTFGDLSSKTNQLDPEGLDETARTEFRWVAAARVGVGRTLGPARFFATAGLAVAGLDNSVTDLDRSGLNDPWHLDPDDSFSASANAAGWTASLGAEAQLADAWLLRLEGVHFDFGHSTHEVNRSANGHCGPGNPRRPCPYRIENKLSILRLALIRRFGFQ